MTTEQTGIEEFFEQLQNRVELLLTSRSFVCSILQKDGKPAPHFALDFKAEVQTDSVKRHFATSVVRVVPFAGPYSKRPNGEIIQGSINANGKNLEVALTIPESAFLALFSEKTGLIASVWLFEPVENWNTRDALHVREVSFQSRESEPNN